MQDWYKIICGLSDGSDLDWPWRLHLRSETFLTLMRREILACINNVHVYMNCRVHMACNNKHFTETEGLLNVTASHAQCNVHFRDTVTNRKWCHNHHNRFTALFSGTTRVSRCQKRTSGLYGARGDQRLGTTPSRLTSAHLHHPPSLTGSDIYGL